MSNNSMPIAVVGMALRVPGAKTPERFWENILSRRDSLTRYSSDELRRMGVPLKKITDPSFVTVCPDVQDITFADTSFFDIPDFEADLTAAGHKTFLECSWEALERAGFAPGEETLRTGVFAGSESDYLETDLKEFVKNDGAGSLGVQFRIGNSSDFMPARVSHKLGFQGPSISILAACATSLVAIHEAMMSLRSGECDLAIAGGSTVIHAFRAGYPSNVEGLFSARGQLRPFDSQADGTVFGSGVGCVLLQRLDDAVAAGSPIVALIRGSGISNDGDPEGKESFTAPSPEGQKAAIVAALKDADISPETIGLVEAHGTATQLGDPTEVKSLSEVYSKYTDVTGYCSLSSVKANIGHTRSAAGVSSLIKTCLALKNKTLPPATNFDKPNPDLKIDTTPFFVHKEPIQWEDGEQPRRAAVSSFGFGGSNAHIVLEEYIPEKEQASEKVSDPQLVVLSAKSKDALKRRQLDLAGYIKSHQELSVPDAAFTLQCGRQAMNYRSCFYLDGPDYDSSGFFQASPDVEGVADPLSRDVAFLFPGQGSQHPGMAEGLYASEPLYKEVVDQCAELLLPLMGQDIRELIQSGEGMSIDGPGEVLRQTANAQPALFVVEYAMARLFMSWGVSPSIMLGHSVGELTAACLAGVFSLEDGLKIVAARSRLMQECRPGAMAAVFLSASEVVSQLPEKLELGAVNGPMFSVVSGPIPAVDKFCKSLDDKGVGNKMLATSHAFHSWMMDDALPAFREVLSSVKLFSPNIPIVSNVTGKLLTAAEATDPQYWSDHIRHTVQFSPGLDVLLKEGNPVCLEVGPGATLTNLVMRQEPEAAAVEALGVNPKEERRVARLAMGKVWAAGGEVDWAKLHNGFNRSRVELPTYPFQRYRHHVDKGETESKHEFPLKLYEPGWTLKELDAAEIKNKGIPWIIFADDCGLADSLIPRINRDGEKAIVVRSGDAFKKLDESNYIVRPASKEDLSVVLSEIKKRFNADGLRVVHLWGVTGGKVEHNTVEAFSVSIEQISYTALGLMNAAFESACCEGMELSFVSDGWLRMPEETIPLHTEKGNLNSTLRSIPVEFPQVSVRMVDFVEVDSSGAQDWMSDQLYDELRVSFAYNKVLLRDSGRFVEEVYPIRDLPLGNFCLRENGVVLVTGGVGSLGLRSADLVYKASGAKLALTTRWAPPDRSEWEKASLKDDKIGRALRQILELEKAGAEVMLVVGDMVNYDDVDRMVSEVEEYFGSVNGVIHAAGVVAPELMVDVHREISEKVYGGKVLGAFHLDRRLGAEDLDFFVHYSSVATYGSSPGQFVYAAANGVLESLAKRRASTMNGLSCAIGWGAWEEIGMAVDHIVYDKHPGSLGSSEEKEIKSEALDSLLFHSRKVYADGRVSFDVLFVEGEDGAPDWLLDHRLMGTRSLIPGMGIIETVRSAYELHVDSKGAMVNLSDVAFVRPLFVDEEGTDVQIIFTPKGNGESFVVRARSRLEGAEWVQTSMGFCELCEKEPVRSFDIPKEDLAASSSESIPHKYIVCGDRWKSFVGSVWKDDIKWTELNLPDEFVSDLSEYRLHPSLLDMCLVGWGEMKPGCVPFAMGSVHVHDSLVQHVFVRGSYTNVGDTLLFHMDIMDENGRLLVELKNYEKRAIDPDKYGKKKLAAKSMSDSAEQLSCFRTALASVGDLGSFERLPLSMPEPGPDEIVIKVVAASLNFKDVLTALGQIDGVNPENATLGGECSGRVSSVGADVTMFKLGDPVVALAHGSFASHVIIKAEHAMLVPPEISFEEAAAVPIVFLTADYALKELADLKKGERVLIHAAAGGVGLAAVQIAQKIGAEIFATAGRDEKRDYLRSLGVEHIMDSRSLDFVDDINKITNGEGVDVILNSLAGEFIPAGFSVLRKYGRFIEIGKRDLFADTKIGLSPFLKNLKYSALDLGLMIDDMHPDIPKKLDSVMCQFARQELKPTPTMVLPIDEISNGFQFMSRAQNIGKIVFRVSVDSDLWQAKMKSFRDAFHVGVDVRNGFEALRRLLSCDQVPTCVLALGSELEDARTEIRPGVVLSGRKNRPQLDVPYADPTNELEKKMAEIWEKLLGISQIGIDDDYIDLGGDSVTAIQVQYAINESFSVKLPSSALFDYSTVRTMAELVREVG